MAKRKKPNPPARGHALSLTERRQLIAVAEGAYGGWQTFVSLGLAAAQGRPDALENWMLFLASRRGRAHKPSRRKKAGRAERHSLISEA